MRGLPAPPADVLQIQSTWDVSSVSECTNAWWLFAPGADAATPAQLEALLGDFFLGPIGDLLAIVGSDVVCSALRLSTYGSSPFRVQVVPAFNVGALSESTALNACTCLTWRTSERLNGGRAHTYLPLPEDFIDDDRVHLKSISYSQAQSAARGFVQDTNTITSPDGATCVLVTLHRSLGGTPLHAALMSPIELGDASPFIGTLRRRIRARRPQSSPV